MYIWTHTAITKNRKSLSLWLLCSWYGSEFNAFTNLVVPRHLKPVTWYHSIWWRINLFLEDCLLILGFCCVDSEFLYLDLLFFLFVTILDRDHYWVFLISWTIDVHCKSFLRAKSNHSIGKCRSSFPPIMLSIFVHSTYCVVFYVFLFSTKTV